MKTRVKEIEVYYKDGSEFRGNFNDAPHLEDSNKIFHREDGPAVSICELLRR